VFFAKCFLIGAVLLRQLILRHCEERSAEAICIEAPCSKLQGIFDPQGSTIYFDRPLTPSKLRGKRSLLDSRTMQTRCSFSASLSLQSPHAFAIMSAVGIRRLRADGFPGKPADNFSFSLFNGG
jgi:hypothetical protein